MSKMSASRDVESVLSALYSYLCRELSEESLPWVSQADFLHDWWGLYHENPGFHHTVEMKTKRCPPVLPSSTTFLQSPDLDVANPTKLRLFSLIQSLKLTQLCLSGNSIPEEDNSMQVDPPLNNSPLTTGCPLPDGHLPDSDVREMIDSLSDQQENPFDLGDGTTTTILSMSMETPEAVEDPQERFQIGGIETGNREQEKKQPLQKLTRVSRKGVAGHPKKEYFRCQHIRGLKKSIRQAPGKKAPKASIHRITTESQRARWDALHEFYLANASALRSISDTAVGPITDGKKKKQQQGKPQADPKSYNNSYCKDFFSTSVVQIYNALYSDLVYSGDPEEMCLKMKVSCCMGQHCCECDGVWQDIWEYARVGMLEELGLEVSVPERQGMAVESYLSTNS